LNNPGAQDDVLLIMSIDTEEDNWEPRVGEVTLDNIRELPRLQTFLRGLGARPTYFTAYRVLQEPWAAATIRALHEEGTTEIGAHLHPWNTPPLGGEDGLGTTMLKNLSPAIQLAKLERVTAALTETVGTPPTAFRAGRYGFDGTTVEPLLRCGYRIDSSVTPYIDWEDTDRGSNFVGAPVDAYRVAPGHDVRTPAPRGPLLEIPLSIGYTRSRFDARDALRRKLEGFPWRLAHLAGIAWRTGLVRRVILSPETNGVRDMLALSRRLIERGTRHLQMTWHSPSLRPGLSPFVTTARDRDRFYGAIQGYVEGLARLTTIRFATVSEAGAALDPASRHEAAVF
jgi:hypothetical protein